MEKEDFNSLIQAIVSDREEAIKFATSKEDEVRKVRTLIETTVEQAGKDVREDFEEIAGKDAEVKDTTLGWLTVLRSILKDEDKELEKGDKLWYIR